MIRPLRIIALIIAAALISSALVATSSAAAATKTVTDKKAKVTVTPYDGVTTGKITVKFSKAQTLKNRSVQLQQLSGGSWVDVGEAKPMSATGSVTFTFPQPDAPAAADYSLPSPTSSYRAVAAAVPSKSKFKNQAVTPAAKSKLLIDQAATLVYNPVGGGSYGSLTVTFSSSYRTKNRPVHLQVLKSGKWKNVGKKVKMTSAGVAVFANVFTTASDSGNTYRAVASKYKTKLKTVTVPATPTTTWKLLRDYSFATGAANNSEWSTWDDGNYNIRLCSANSSANTTMTGGYATLTVKDAGKTGLAAARTAGCPEAQTYAYTNGMVSTFSKFTITNGIVAARIKFSKSQYMHGGIWLYSADDEIDIIESYGYAGKNSLYSKTTSGVHQMLSQSAHNELIVPVGWEKSYGNGLSQTVFNIRKLSSSWFAKYHVVSVEFTSTKLVYRIDGKVTGTLTRAKTENTYSLVMSMLTTSWELASARNAKVKKLTVPASMKVDWVRVWQK